MAKDESTEETEGKKKKGKMGLLIPAVVLAVGMAGGGYFFMSSKKDAGAAAGVTTTTTTHPGPIIRLDPITLNLTDGHVLKVGLALEAVAEPKDKEMATIVAGLHGGGGGHGGGGAAASTASPMSGLESKALDIAIAELGNKSFQELSAPGGRTHAKEELQKEIQHAYHGDITEVYFTTFVMS